jgi:hypothetical protein
MVIFLAADAVAGTSRTKKQIRAQASTVINQNVEFRGVRFIFAPPNLFIIGFFDEVDLGEIECKGSSLTSKPVTSLTELTPHAEKQKIRSFSRKSPFCCGITKVEDDLNKNE